MGCFAGAAPDLPLAGGERVWKSGRRHLRLEPAPAALTQQRVQPGSGLPEPEVEPVLTYFQNKTTVSHSSVFQWPDDEAGVQTSGRRIQIRSSCPLSPGTTEFLSNC